MDRVIRVGCDSMPEDWAEVDADDMELRAKDGSEATVISLSHATAHRLAEFIQRHIPKPKYIYRPGDVVTYQGAMALVEDYDPSTDKVSLRRVGGHHTTVTAVNVFPVVRDNGEPFEKEVY